MIEQIEQQAIAIEQQAIASERPPPPEADVLTMGLEKQFPDKFKK